MSPEYRDTGWDRGWEGHQLAQLRRLAHLSLREKIAWLEDAQAVASHLTQARARAVRSTYVRAPTTAEEKGDRRR